MSGGCSIDECERPAKNMGFCAMHYMRLRRNGDPLLGARKTPGECSAEECDRTAESRGFCVMHYKRMKRNGTLGLKRKYYRTNEDAFAAHATGDSGDCLVWTGATTKDGYGRMQVDARPAFAHRYAWEQANGPIPIGMYVDHMCHNPSCVRVSHLRVVRPRHNSQNRKGADRGSRSGVRNVYWNERWKRWCVRMVVDGKSYSGKTFSDLAEAERAAIELRKEVMPWSIK